MRRPGCRPARLHRSDIEDLVVRRFRSSPEVVADIGREVPKRELFPRYFPLSAEEEVAYQAIADLHLDHNDVAAMIGDVEDQPAASRFLRDLHQRSVADLGMLLDGISSWQ